MKKKLVVYTSLLGVLLSSHFILDKHADMFDKRIEIHQACVHEDDINIVAHRGYSCLYPDNTLASIEACNDINCIDGIEVDVRITKDDKLVLFHESSVNFFSVSSYTYDELCAKNVDNYIKNTRYYKGYNISEMVLLEKRYERLREEPAHLCTLEDALRVRNKDKMFFVDIKFSGYHDDVLIYKLANLLHNEPNVILQSFDGELLSSMQKLYPEFEYQLLIDRASQLEDIDYSFDAYGIKYNVALEDTVEDLISHNKKVSLWVVDSIKELTQLEEEYQEYNDDIYYISDNPDMICFEYRKK